MKPEPELQTELTRNIDTEGKSVGKEEGRTLYQKKLAHHKNTFCLNSGNRKQGWERMKEGTPNPNRPPGVHSGCWKSGADEEVAQVEKYEATKHYETTLGEPMDLEEKCLPKQQPPARHTALNPTDTD